VHLNDDCFLELESRVGLDQARAPQPPATTTSDSRVGGGGAVAAPVRRRSSPRKAQLKVGAAHVGGHVDVSNGGGGGGSSTDREVPHVPLSEAQLLLPQAVVQDLSQQLSQSQPPQASQPPAWPVTQASLLPDTPVHPPPAHGATYLKPDAGAQGHTTGDSGLVEQGVPMVTQQQQHVVGDGSSAGGDSSGGGGGGGRGWQSAVWRAAASQAAPEVLEPAVAAAAAAMVQPDKFSVHLIVRAPGGWVFPNCQAVGAAVGALRWVGGWTCGGSMLPRHLAWHSYTHA
jgi:hypothetical protein